MDNIYLSTIVSAEEKQTKFQGLLEFHRYHSYQPDEHLGIVAKKGREPFRPWVPSAKEIAALEGTVALPCQGNIPKYTTHIF
jgi:ubiquitin carboxyl-terminal hydrolase 22/27/51